MPEMELPPIKSLSEPLQFRTTPEIETDPIQSLSPQFRTRPEIESGSIQCVPQPRSSRTMTSIGIMTEMATMRNVGIMAETPTMSVIGTMTEISRMSVAGTMTETTRMESRGTMPINDLSVAPFAQFEAAGESVSVVGVENVTRLSWPNVPLTPVSSSWGWNAVSSDNVDQHVGSLGPGFFGRPG
jgi:hypothetical protein